MKKVLLLMIAILSGVTMYASDDAMAEAFYRLRGQKKFNIVVDWSQYTINGLNEEDWMRFRDTEQPNYDAHNELVNELKPRFADMAKEANEVMSKAQIYLFLNDDRQPYTIVVRPLRLDGHGNQTDIITIKDTSTGEQIVQFQIKAKGGKFGSMSNLWGDGFRRAGKQLGKTLLKYLT